jgi:uncharacterized lipoprotein
MRRLALVALAALVAALGACSVKEEKTVQQPTASAPASSTAPAGTTTSKTYSLF